MWLTRLSLRRPVTLAMMLATIVILGAVSIIKLPLDFLPRMEMPFIGVQVPVNNGIPSQVEREIVAPIEEILSTLGGVRELTSYSDSDGAFVGVQFDWGRDVNMLRMEVKEKIDQIRPDLPADVRQVFLFTFNTSDIPIMEGRISAKGRDLSSSWDLLDQKIIQPLQRIPGVGRVNIDGVMPTQVSVYLNFDKILEHNVDVSRLFQELSAANVELSVGEVMDDGMRYGVRTVSGITSVEQLRELPINERGLRLRDVADVLYGAPGMAYGRYLNGEPAIAFWIQKASGYNTVEVCEAINRELEKINSDPTLSGISSVPFFDQSEQITDSLRSLTQGGLIGSLLSIVILFFFLRRVGMTLVISIAIPMSILGTTVFLYLTGRTLNVLSMMGLMLGVGMLVDNAVVVLESISRKQHEGYNPIAAAIRGTREVAKAITASTLTTVIVFAPIILSKNDETAVWLGEVGVTISVTLIFSLLVSLTVIPMLSVRLSGKSGLHTDSSWIIALRKRYERVLSWTALRHPLITALAIVPLVLVLTGAMIKITNFGPDTEGSGGMRRDNLYVFVDFADNVDKYVAEDAILVAQEYLEGRQEELGLNYIYSFYAAGRGGISLFFEKGVISEDFYRDLRDDLRDNLPVQAGVKYLFGNEDGTGSGVKTFNVTIYGEDTEYLYEKAETIKGLLGNLEGISDVRSDSEDDSREIRVNVDNEAAGRFGITASTISEIMGLTYRGVMLPRLNTGTKEVDMIVSLDPADRESIENLAILTVGEANGQAVQLQQVADFTIGSTPQRIQRTDRRSGVTIRGTYDGEELKDALDMVRQVMDQVPFPLGYGWSFGSDILRSQQQSSEMGLNMLLALACVFFVMASLFESLLHPLVVMACVPFASVGVFWIMMATGTPFSIMAMIGMVILIGIVVNNGIVLVDHVNHHRRHGLSIEDALMRACGERLRPILMTAGTTILGLMPLAVLPGAHVAGAEYYPMARAIIGGLASSTLLTLIVLPTYYLLADRYTVAFRATLRRMAVR